MKIKLLHIQKVTGICGSENHLYTLLTELSKANYELSFLVLTEPNNLMDEYVELFAKSIVKIERMIINRDVDPIFFFKLWQFIRRNKFHIVHTHLFHADLYGTLAAKLAKVPIIISTRHGCNEFRHNKFYGTIDRTISRFSNKIITASDALQVYLKDVERLDTKKMVTIYYGLDEAYSKKRDNNDLPIRNEFGISVNAPLIGIVARLIPIKGHVYLLDAFKKVLGHIPSAKLLIVGDGELKEKLIQICKDLGIFHNVIFTGFRKNVNKIMQEIDLFVLSSLGEGFGLVCLEAMAMGKPIVASNIMAIPEIVANGETGILVPPKNPQALTEAILKLLKDPELAKKMGKDGEERVKKYFTKKKMVERIQKVYVDLVESKLGLKCNFIAIN